LGESLKAEGLHRFGDGLFGDIVAEVFLFLDLHPAYLSIHDKLLELIVVDRRHIGVLHQVGVYGEHRYKDEDEVPEGKLEAFAKQ